MGSTFDFNLLSLGCNSYIPVINLHRDIVQQDYLQGLDRLFIFNKHRNISNSIEFSIVSYL